MQHRFIIGIGSQRAGSTLLHRLLGASTGAFMHPVKELHYFDTLYGYRSRDALKDYSMRQLSREINVIVSAKDYGFINDRYRCYLRTNKLLWSSDIEEVDYLDLFRPNLRRASLLGETTPEYMLLSDDDVEKMQRVVGSDAAIVLLCRNPVSRVLSAMKLVNSYNNLSMSSEEADEWLHRMLDEETPWLKAQDGYNSYREVIRRYSARFKHFAAISYDQLIGAPGATANRLSACLGIAIDAERFEAESTNVMNDLGEDFVVSDRARQRIAERYRDSSDFLGEYFKTDIVK